MNPEITLRSIEKKDFSAMKKLLYEAIYQEPDTPKLPFDVIEKPEIRNYIDAFETGENDLGVVAEFNGKAIGAAWSRILFSPVRGCGNLDATTPELAIALFPEYRGRGFGTRLLNAMTLLWLNNGVRQVSLSVNKRNRAVSLYRRFVFETVRGNPEDFIMCWNGFVSAPVMTDAMTAEGNPEKAEGMKRFFKTAPGEYGEGDRFLGLPNPVVRAFVRKFKYAPLTEILKLTDSVWHEIRLCGGLLMAEHYRHACDDMRETIFQAYLKRAERFNNWDLVDLTAPGIVGEHLLKRKRTILRKLAASSLLWEQRIAMVSTLTLIRHGEFSDTLELAELLLAHPHDLIHKACGWMLREVGKRDRAVLTAFLMKHKSAMPRTMLQYAIEHYSPEERKVWLKK